MVGNSSTPMMHLHCLNLSITTAIVPPRTNGVLGARLLTIVGSFPLQTNCPSPSTLDFSKMNNTFSSCRKSLCKNNPFDVLYEIGVHPCRNWTKTTDRMHVVIAWFRNNKFVSSSKPGYPAAIFISCFTSTNKTPVDIIYLACEVHQVLQYYAKKSWKYYKYVQTNNKN